MPTLKQTFTHLRAVAQRTGRWQGCQLAGGARVDVRTLNQGATLRVCLSRPDKPLGAVELVTFVRHFGIPDVARRAPEDPTQQEVHPDGRHYVIYDWEPT